MSRTRRADITSASTMFRTLAILCFVAASAFGRLAPGFEVTFDANPPSFGVTSFVKMPQTFKEACKMGWTKVKQPAVPAEYKKLKLRCPKDDHHVCILYDDTGYVAGMQIGLNAERIANPVFSWTAAGFTNWTVTENGKETTYYTTRQYFVSPEFLATSAEIRKANRDSSKLLQDDHLHLVGFNGKISKVPTKVADMLSEGVYTEQACVPAMGKHYYHSMRKDLECRVDTIATWFLLVDNDEIVGTGFMLPGKYEPEDGKRAPFEEPTRPAIQMIVPNGPECLYNYGDVPGVITMHTYFIDNGFQLKC